MGDNKFIVTGDQYRTIDRRMREIKNQLDRKSGSSLDPVAIARTLQKIIDGQKFDEFFQLNISQLLSLDKLIKFGKYDIVHPDINEKNFILKIEMKWGAALTAELVKLNSKMCLKEIINKFSDLGLRFATIEELLYFGISYPNLQYQYSVVCLGPPFRSFFSENKALYLGQHEMKRTLSICKLDNSWLDHARFLGIHL